MTINIYGIDNCRYCEKTKIALKTAGVPFNYIHVNDSDKASFMDDFNRIHKNSSRTFPQVEVIGRSKTTGMPELKLVGGYTDTLDFLLNGGFDDIRFSEAAA